MDDEFTPETQPGASLDPPVRKPPTAVGTAELPGPDPGQPSRALSTRRLTAGRGWLGKWINEALDVVDVLADAAREQLNRVLVR